jgi:hypothetical protein
MNIFNNGANCCLFLKVVAPMPQKTNYSGQKSHSNPSKLSMPALMKIAKGGKTDDEQPNQQLARAASTSLQEVRCTKVHNNCVLFLAQNLACAHKGVLFCI